MGFTGPSHFDDDPFENTLNELNEELSPLELSPNNDAKGKEVKTINHDFQRFKFDKPLFQVAAALLSPKPSGDELTCPKAPKKQVNSAEDIKSIPYILFIENNNVPFRRNGGDSFLQRLAAMK